MEFLTFLNGAWIMLNVVFLVFLLKKKRPPKDEIAAEPQQEVSSSGKPTKEKQWEDFLSYDGNVGVNNNAD